LVAVVGPTLTADRLFRFKQGFTGKTPKTGFWSVQSNFFVNWLKLGRQIDDKRHDAEGWPATLVQECITARKRSTARLTIPIPNVVFPASSAANFAYEPAFGDQFIGIYFRSLLRDIRCHRYPNPNSAAFLWHAETVR
jgi:hypothetical protein